MSDQPPTDPTSAPVADRCLAADPASVELRIAESERRTNEALALLDTLQSNAPIGFGFVDRDFRIMRTNDILASVNGSTREEQIGRTIVELVPELWPQLEPLYRGMLESGQPVLDVAVEGPTAADPTRTHQWLSSFYPLVVHDEVIGIAVIVVDITERSDAEAARRQLATIVEDSGEAIFSSTPDGLTTTWNAAAERLFGYTAKEMIGQPIALIAPPELIGEQEDMRERLSAGSATERLETTRRRKDGELVDVMVTATPSTDRSGAVVGVSVIVQDITTRRAAELELEVSQQRLAEAQRIAEVGSFEVDVLTGAISWSDEHYRILGLDRGLTPSHDLFLSVVHPDDRPALIRAWERAGRDGVGFDLVYRIVRADREQRWVNNRAVADRAEDGRVLKWAGTLRDNTDRVEDSRERREADTRFETGFEQAGIGAAIINLDGIPSRVNDAVSTILGRPREELINRSWDAYRLPGDENQGVAVQARMAVGADDYADERRFVRPDGSLVWTSLHLTLVRDESGTPQYYLAQLEDITERKRLQEELAHRALHDGLTGLPNGTLLTDRLAQALAGVRRRGSQLGVVFLDVDQFKAVNDSFGHAVGDRLLRAVADRITATIEISDTVGRLNGDEFAIICADASPSETAKTAERVLAALRQPFAIADRFISVTASVGVAMAGDNSTPNSLLRGSSDGMHQAKRLGRNRIELFDEALRVKAEERLAIATALRHALERNEFTVYYQPVIDLSTGMMVSAEALLRWVDPDLGAVSPARFIPIAEELGLIVPIGAWVLERACEHLRQWQRSDPTMTVAVNLSARQIQAPNIVKVVADVLERTHVPPESLYLELTESVFAHDVEYFDDMMAGLKDLGVQLSLDDFGTGYSSLSYLSRFPFDAIKIDQSFVRGLGTNPHDTALVTAILSMAEALGLSVTAEGIEHQGQLAALREMRCDRAQGFYLDHPLAASAMQELLARSHRWLVNSALSATSAGSQPGAGQASVAGAIVESADTPQASQPSALAQHQVLFYGDEPQLLRDLTAFVSAGLASTGHAVVIASQEHLSALRETLPQSWLGRAEREGRFVGLDAEQTLTQVMRDGHVDPERFEQVVAVLVRAHSSQGGALHVYEELGAVLWRSGNLAGGLQLERRWNQIRHQANLDLLCAYPLSDIPANPGDAVTDICHQHTRVHLNRHIGPDGDRGVDVEQILLDSTRALLRAGSAEQAVGTLMRAVAELGGTCIPATQAPHDAIQIDINLGHASPLLPMAPHGSQARRTIERVLPSLVEDAHIAAETAARISGPSGAVDTDVLTGLGTERRLGELPKLIKSDTVAMLDLDNFKGVNQTHGRETGDRLLVAFSRTVRQRLRSTDLVFRLDGAQIMLILPDTEPHSALIVLEQIRLKWNTERTHPVTFSAGIARIEEGDLDTAMRTADAALYAAKAHGRDRFEIITSADEPNASDLAVARVRRPRLL